MWVYLREGTASRVKSAEPVACRQRVVFEAHSGSNGRRFLSTPLPVITGLLMHAACTFGLAAAVRPGMGKKKHYPRR